MRKSLANRIDDLESVLNPADGACAHCSEKPKVVKLLPIDLEAQDYGPGRRLDNERRFFCHACNRLLFVLRTIRFDGIHADGDGGNE